MAVVIALLALLLLTATAAGFLIAINVGTNTTGRHVRYSQALNIAEAGVAEAAQRIRWGDVPNNGNPLMVTQIFNAPGGSIPALGTDSTALATAQPDSEMLAYSSERRSPYALTIKYKTDASRSVIYRYDPSASPAVQTVSGSPIFEITSIGRKGTDRSKVVTEVFMRPIQVAAKAALAANVNIKFTGNSSVCGYNHDVNTPAGTKDRGPCLAYELASGHLPGAWTTGSTTVSGSSTQYGDPVAIADGQANFYDGPWQVLNMTQAEFFQWIGSAVGSEPMPPKGIFYLDNNGTSQDQSGDFAYHGGDGEGFLYVEGDLKVNGGTWVLGGLICRGKTEIKHANGDACVLFSKDAISQYISKYGGTVATLTWRENP